MKKKDLLIIESFINYLDIEKKKENLFLYKTQLSSNTTPQDILIFFNGILNNTYNKTLNNFWNEFFANEIVDLRPNNTFNYTPLEKIIEDKNFYNHFIYLYIKNFFNNYISHHHAIEPNTIMYFFKNYTKSLDVEDKIFLYQSILELNPRCGFSHLYAFFDQDDTFFTTFLNHKFFINLLNNIKDKQNNHYYIVSFSENKKHLLEFIDKIKELNDISLTLKVQNFFNSKNIKEQISSENFNDLELLDEDPIIINETNTYFQIEKNIDISKISEHFSLKNLDINSFFQNINLVLPFLIEEKEVVFSFKIKNNILNLTTLIKSKNKDISFSEEFNNIDKFCLFALQKSIYLLFLDTSNSYNSMNFIQTSELFNLYKVFKNGELNYQQKDLSNLILQSYREKNLLQQIKHKNAVNIKHKI